jgi:hypothetical protein
VDTRPVLGLQSLRPSFLDDLSTARSSQAQTGCRACVVINLDDEDLDDDPDDEDEDLDGDDDDEDEDDDDEDIETWQVSEAITCAKGHSLLDFGCSNCLD